MEVSSRRLAIVQHRHPPARGLLSLISLLSAFLLTGIKRNQAGWEAISVRHLEFARAVQSAALPFSALHRLCPLAVGGVPVVAVLFVLFAL